MIDVVIVGAGPAGSMAAERLAAAGRTVLLLEEHPAVGEPAICTGLIGLEAFDELGLPRTTILSHARSAVFRTRGAAPVRIDSEQLQGAIIDRRRFGEALSARAEESGASLRCDARVEAIEVGADDVCIHVAGDTRPVAARACILACGANYQFHEALGLAIPTHFVEMAHLEVPFPSAPDIEVRMAADLAPGGFAWHVPFEREGATFARLGLSCERGALEHFRAFVTELAGEYGIDPTALPSPRVKIQPFWPSAKTYADRVLAVGDAAGLVKPTTGAGIYYGLLSGRCAAQVIDEAIRADELSAARLRLYEQEWGHRLGGEIRAGLALRAIWTRLDERAILTLFNAARADATADLRRVVLESFLT